MSERIFQSLFVLTIVLGGIYAIGTLLIRTLNSGNLPLFCGLLRLVIPSAALVLYAARNIYRDSTLVERQVKELRK